MKYLTETRKLFESIEKSSSLEIVGLSSVIFGLPSGFLRKSNYLRPSTEYYRMTVRSH